MNRIIEQLRAELCANADEKTIGNYQWFFKETVKFYGVRFGTVGAIARRYWKEIKTLHKKEIFSLCEDLFRSDYSEEAAIVGYWVPNLTNQFEPSDLDLFKRWIDSYVNDWAKCDGFCNHTIG